MKIRLAYTLALFALPVLANTPPEITNVRASQRTDTKLVDIYYDAADADGDLLKVRIEISDNDGVKYSVPAFSLTGDIGEGIAAGKDKHIVWDAGTDWDGEYSDKMRVKVFAIDAQGFPGLEWGNEVPPGGFLMGQDGGAEGGGESRHVNIAWSYWLGKYEVTCGQYCDFLNQALNAGYVERDGTAKVKAASQIPLELVAKPLSVLCQIGDDQNIRWRVNRFEPTSETFAALPAAVTWDGAIAFARFYGYDLPTEAEWEKAARGPDHDDQDEHVRYPWGDEVSAAYANIAPHNGLTPIGFFDGNQTPVGPDTVNGYGLYDVVGNAAEWTLSAEGSNVSIAEYPQQESLTSILHVPYNATTKIIRGYRGEPLYYRKGALTTSPTLCYLTGYTIQSSYYSSVAVPNYQQTNDPLGFRVVRRAGVESVKAKVAAVQNFSGFDVQNIQFGQSVTNDGWVVGYSSTSWGSDVKIVDGGVDESRCAYLSSGYGAIYLPKTANAIVSVRLKVKGSSNSYYFVQLHSVMPDGTDKSTSETIDDNGTYPVHTLSLNPDPQAEKIYLAVSNGSAYFDDIEVITASAE